MILRRCSVQLTRDFLLLAFTIAYAVFGSAFAQGGVLLPPQGYVDLHTHLTTKYFYAKTKTPVECTQGDSLPYHLRAVNWESFGSGTKAWRKCKPSNYGNYYQANYSELTRLPGSILCNCIYPMEQQLTAKRGKRWISSHLVTKIPMKRLKVNAENTSPWEEFKGEYQFAVKGLHTDPGTGLIIRYPKNSEELLAHLNDPNTINSIFTIEGGQVLYGEHAGNYKTVRGWKCDSVSARELIANVDSLRTWPHRIFFIAPAHFTDNYVVGNAKTLDRRGARLFLHGAGGVPLFNKSLFNKWGEGIHGDLDVGMYKRVPGTCVSLPYTTTPVADTIGWAVFKRFLEPRCDTAKPIYIDLKHMDIQARFEYYQLLREHRNDWGEVPIIASHIAVSGEDRSIAMATGSNPLYDRYPELKHPKRFYSKEARNKNWAIRNKYIYGDTSNPFSGHIDTSTAGWFYPWSINLANEEFVEIHESEGIMGLMLDGRQLGQGMENYDGAYKRSIRTKFEQHAPEFALKADRDTWKDYWEMEPLMRNILYIVEHCGKAGPCWEHLAIGSDMDGLIAPMTVCRTTSDIPELRRKLVAFLPLYAHIHNKQEFTESGIEPKAAMDKLFYTNGRDFIKKWY